MRRATSGQPTIRSTRLGRSSRVAVIAFAVALTALACSNDSESVSTKAAEGTEASAGSDTPTSTTTLQEAAPSEEWTVPASDGLEVRVRRDLIDHAPRRLRADELAAPALIPIPGYAPVTACRAVVTVEVDAPNGNHFSMSYPEILDRPLGFVDGPADSFGSDTTGLRVILATGLAEGSTVVDTAAAPDQPPTTAREGISVIAGLQPLVQYLSKSAPTIAQTLVVRSTDGGKTQPFFPDVFPGYNTTTANTCRARTMPLDGAAATDDARAEIVAVIDAAWEELKSGSFDHIDPDVGVPALADTPEGVLAVLADARTRALESPPLTPADISLVPEAMAMVNPELIVARVTANTRLGSAGLLVDLHRRDGAWKISPQSICAALVGASAYCIPAP